MLPFYSVSDTFVDFQPLAFVTYSFNAILGLLTFVNLMLLLGVLQVNYRFRILTRMVQGNQGQMLTFFLQMTVLHIAFSSAMYSHLGKTRSEWSTFPGSMASLSALLLGGGATFKMGVAAGENSLARIFITVFMIIVVIIFMNFFIASICELIDSVKKELKEMQKQGTDLDPMDFVLKRLKKAKLLMSRNCRNVLKSLKLLK